MPLNEIGLGAAKLVAFCSFGGGLQNQQGLPGAYEDAEHFQKRKAYMEVTMQLTESEDNIRLR